MRVQLHASLLYVFAPEPRGEQILLTRLHGHVLSPAGPGLLHVVRDVHLHAAVAKEAGLVEAHHRAGRSLAFCSTGPGFRQVLPALEAGVLCQIAGADQ